MQIHALAALFIAAAINASIPGPCVVAIAGRTLRGGWRSGATLCCGLILGDVLLVVVALATAAGVVAVSPTAFATLKWGGIAALLAVAALALRPRKETAPGRSRLGGGIVAGFALGVSSPYNLIFYVTVVPSTVSAMLLGEGAELGALPCLAISLAALAGVAIGQAGAVAIAAQLRRGPVGGRWVDYACAALMAGVALTAAMAPLQP